MKTITEEPLKTVCCTRKCTILTGDPLGHFSTLRNIQVSLVSTANTELARGLYWSYKECFPEGFRFMN